MVPCEATLQKSLVFTGRWTVTILESWPTPWSVRTQVEIPKRLGRRVYLILLLPFNRWEKQYSIITRPLDAKDAL